MGLAAIILPHNSRLCCNRQIYEHYHPLSLSVIIPSSYHAFLYSSVLHPHFIILYPMMWHFFFSSSVMPVYGLFCSSDFSSASYRNFLLSLLILLSLVPSSPPAASLVISYFIFVLRSFSCFFSLLILFVIM